jgi:hypothetical protein
MSRAWVVLQEFLQVGTIDRFHYEILPVGVGEVVAYGKQGLVLDLCPAFRLIGERKLQCLELARSGVSDLARAFTQDNLGVVDRIVSFIKSAAFDLAKLMDYSIASLIKDLVGCEHIMGCSSGGEVAAKTYYKHFCKKWKIFVVYGLTLYYPT